MLPKTLSFALAISLGLSTACRRSPEPEAAKAPASPPNVLLITVDTLRADHLGCYGYEQARTPHIDRFADEGVRIEHAIAPTPITLPSHASILTGLEPPAHTVRGNGAFRLPDGAQTLAESLKAEGYQTQAFVSAGVLHRRFNLDQGFDGYDDDVGSVARNSRTVRMRQRSGEQTMDRVLHWLDERTESASPSPFFLWVHLFDPHAPYTPPEAEARLAATPYDGEIASVDRQIGRLVRALEPNGILDDTILVFTSDHGESLGEHEEDTHAIFIYEATQHVPLIFRYPRKLPAGRVYGGPARSVDIMPTILSLAGKKSGETQGADLCEAFASRSPSASRVQYSESFHTEQMFGMARLQGVRQDPWTYIRAPRPELYDRRTDPGELRNLLEGDGSSASKARALELEAALSRVIEDSKRFALVEEANPLDPQTVAMLQALGYMGDSGAPEDLGGIDPKDGIQIINELRRATTLSDADDCMAVARSVLRRLPGYVQAWNTLGRCSLWADDVEAAEEAYRKSLAHEPMQPEIHLQIGHIYFAQGRNENARRHYAQVVELMPELVDPILDMAKVDFRDGQWDEAIRWYKRAIDVEPTRPDPYLMIGEAYFERGELAKARSWYERTLTVAPDRSDSPSLNYTYVASVRAGECALGLGDPEGAEQHLRRASESEPTLWRPLYRLACAEVRQGDLEGALRALQAAAAKGFADLSTLQSDACLRPLVPEPGFQAFVRTLAGRAQR